MNERDPDEYLVSRTGPADPEVERLERVLAPLRYREPREPTSRERSWPRYVAAALVAAAGAWWFLDGWRASAGYAIDGLDGVTRVEVGDELELERDATIEIAELGDVVVEAGSRVRVDDAGRERHRLFLERGKLRARIFAEPRAFQIGTPAGLSVDLGCEYDLAVDPQGVTEVAVLTGRVAFETDGRKVLLPRGSSCQAEPGRGPNAPIFADADLEFARVVRAIEFESAPDEASVARALELARPRDSLTLWHLLDAPSRTLRERVYERLSAWRPPPQDLDAKALLDGDAGQRARWRDRFEDDWY